MSLHFSVWAFLAELIVFFHRFISPGLSPFVCLFPFVFIVYEASHILNLSIFLGCLLFRHMCRWWFVFASDIHKFAFSLDYAILLVRQIFQLIQAANILIELLFFSFCDGIDRIRVIIECGPLFHRITRLAQSYLCLIIIGWFFDEIGKELGDHSNWFPITIKLVYWTFFYLHSFEHLKVLILHAKAFREGLGWQSTSHSWQSACHSCLWKGAVYQLRLLSSSSSVVDDVDIGWFVPTHGRLVIFVIIWINDCISTKLPSLITLCKHTFLQIGVIRT